MDTAERQHQSQIDRMASYPLLQALIDRRSRRFGKGMRLNGGPLAYGSTDNPQPLSLEEEAALAFAACGITGYALGELSYQSGDVPEAGGGNIMTHFIGRTVPSGDAMHAVTVFVTNDHGAWMLSGRRIIPAPMPPDLSRMRASTGSSASTNATAFPSPIGA